MSNRIGYTERTKSLEQANRWFPGRTWAFRRRRGRSGYTDETPSMKCWRMLSADGVKFVPSQSWRLSRRRKRLTPRSGRLS